MEIPTTFDTGKVSIKLPQNFDKLALASFRQVYAEILNDSVAKTIELDFAGVEHIDSSALGSLLLLHDRAEKAARPVVLTNCQPNVMKVMTMTHFHRIFDIH